MDIAHATITKNVADSDGNDSGAGGGIFFDTDDELVATLRGSIIAQNYSENSSTIDDCENNAGLTSFTYSYLGEDTGCSTTYGAGAGNVATTSSDSVFLADLVDRGGDVNVIAAGVAGVTVDVIAAAQCKNAAGNSLTQDARGLARPENTSCDMGSFELDQTDPVLSVESGTDTIECGIDTWTDAGATVTDNFSSGLTATAAGSVTEETVGTYTITYTTADVDGNEDSDTRTVTVQDGTGPAITVAGNSSQSITEGDTFTDAGATAVDACEGSKSVTSSGSVDPDTPGSYTITYTAVDSRGNQSTATRRVTVEELSIRTNGKYVRVFSGDTKIAQKKVRNKTLKKKYRRLKVGKVYKGKAYRTIAFVGVSKKKKAKLVVLRLNTSNELKKKRSKTFTVQKRKKPSITFKPKKKRIVVSVAKGDNKVKRVYKLQKDGDLKRIK